MDTTINQAIELKPFAATTSSQFSEKATLLSKQLASLEATAVLQDCGMAAKVQLLQQATTSQPTPSSPPSSPSPSSTSPVSQHPGLEPTAVTTALRSFDAKLLDLGTLAIPFIEKINDDYTRIKVRKIVAELISDSYAVFYNAILNPTNQYPNPSSLVRYKPEQVKAMIAPM